ncbi:MAG: sodium-translocating pyrophosphatase [Thermotogaceae bacterium]|nr:sodium-translocating pyrophosphatase [Thermotogaceae bacterium]
MALLYALIISIIALSLAYINYKKVVQRDEGTEKMKQISQMIREGAATFLRHENSTVFKVMLPIAIVLMITTTWHVGIAFILGATLSMLAGVFGMKSATQANVRVTNEARKTKSIANALKVAYLGGSVMGLSVAGLSILGLVVVYFIFGKLLGQLSEGKLIIETNWLGINFIPFTMTVSGYALGCSLMALFDRVGGGVYTKAADMAADLVGKTELKLPEDDPRNPATIADNVGDNVGDVAGLGADLLESFVGALVSSTILAAYMFRLYKGISYETTISLVDYPIALAATGLLSSIVGILFVISRKKSKDPQKTLDGGLWTSAILTILLSFLITYWIFHGKEDLANVGFRYGWASPWGALIIGIVVGIAMGNWAEYYTSDKFKPTRILSYQSKRGVGVVISNGLALGMESTFMPTLTLAAGILISDLFAGLYGVAISAAGMLSFVATAVSTDSYGPIADNAGGISEMAGLEEDVRKITDRLDSVGNTTAAIGKGFAIGSAALAALSLFASYIFSQISPKDLENLRSVSQVLVLNMMNAKTIAGALMGAALPFMFSGMLIKSVADSAGEMVEEIRRQFKVNPEIAEGKTPPDYNRCIEICSSGALRKMKAPAFIAVFTPLISGFLFGTQFVGGLLIGTLLSGVMLAIFCANSGGAWDNAKKYLEQGNIEGIGKGTEEHSALVVGDTVGDPLKDTVGPSLDILIKIMSVVSIIASSIFKVYHLF